MGSGGSRNRSGPQPDEGSERSARRGVSFQALPAEGYTGPIPDFPLPLRRVYFTAKVDGQPAQFENEAATALIAEREAELWEWVWRTPQACAWAMPSEHWRWHTVAMWVRTAALCESSEATAADKNSLHRFADQIGRTPAGLNENGWKIATDEVAEQASKSNVEPASARKSSRDRMKVVNGGGT